MTAIKYILAEVEAYMRATDTPPTRFGVECDNDRSLVFRLRAGRAITIAKAERIMNYIHANKPTKRPAKKPRRAASLSLVA